MPFPAVPGVPDTSGLSLETQSKIAELEVRAGLRHAAFVRRLIEREGVKQKLGANLDPYESADSTRIV